MIHIDNFTLHGYTLLVNGNDGEEQLVIIMSGGQNKKTKVSVIAAAVDFGMRVMTTDETVKDINLRQRLRELLVQWVSYGIPPTSEQLEAQRNIIDNAILNSLEV